MSRPNPVVARARGHWAEVESRGPDPYRVGRQTEFYYGKPVEFLQFWGRIEFPNGHKDTEHEVEVARRVFARLEVAIARGFKGGDTVTLWHPESGAAIPDVKLGGWGRFVTLPGGMSTSHKLDDFCEAGWKVLA